MILFAWLTPETMRRRAPQVAPVSKALEPCVRCLTPKPFRKRAGENRGHCIIQCGECGFNVSAAIFALAEAAWNGFRVWELVHKKKRGFWPW